MSFPNHIISFLFNKIERAVPTASFLIFRKEKQGCSFFDKTNMKFGHMDDLGREIFNEIDDSSDCREIFERVSKKKKIPRVLLAETFLRYLKFFKDSGLININATINRNFKSSSKKKKENLCAPFQVAAIITNECNLHCSHCGNENRERKENELSKEEWFKFIDECAKIGVFVFNITGGEPFIRKDWFEILDHIRGKNIEVGVTSNGTLIDEDLVKKLKKLNIFNIHISLDGVGDVHDYFRNQKGVFQKVCNTIKLLKFYEIPFGVTTAVSKRNIDKLNELEDFIRENNIYSWEIFFAIPLGCMKKEEALTKEEIIKLAEKIADYKKELKDAEIFIGDNLGYYDKYNLQSDWEGCRAGIRICAVDSEGNIKGCPIHPSSFIEGNIREKSLKEIWDNPNAFSYNRKPCRLEKHCGKCKHSLICRGGCKASMHAQGTGFKYNEFCLYHLEQEGF